jgi:hypothetical protein
MTTTKAQLAIVIVIVNNSSDGHRSKAIATRDLHIHVEISSLRSLVEKRMWCDTNGPPILQFRFLSP